MSSGANTAANRRSVWLRTPYGDQALFMRRDEVESAWRWIDSIIDGWDESRQKVESYVSGSWGPTAASVLLDRDGRAWHPES